MPADLEAATDPGGGVLVIGEVPVGGWFSGAGGAEMRF